MRGGHVPVPDRLPIPALTSSSWYRWTIGTFIVLVVMGAYCIATDQANPWVVLGTIAFVVVGFGPVYTLRTWIETRTGTVVWQRVWFWHIRRELADAQQVAISGDGGGSVALALQFPGQRRRRGIPLLALNGYVERSQDADTLRGLATVLAAWVPVEALGTIPATLESQAVHLDAGGALVDCPLAKGRRRWGGAVGGAGAFGSGSNLID